MATWVLVLYFTSMGDRAGATHVPGFTSSARCEAEGRRIEAARSGLGQGVSYYCVEVK